MHQLTSRLLYFLGDFYGYIIVSTITVVTGLVIIWKLHKNTQRHINILLAITTGAMALVMFFIPAEAYFRYVYEASDGIGFLKIARKWHDRYVIFNGNYRRDREFTMEKPSGEIRIAAIGDSLTFGIGIENPADRLSNLLESKLIKDGFNVAVYNLGISGSDTNDQIIAFHQMEVFDFDIVVWQYFMNDVNSATNSANAQITKNSQTRLTKHPLAKYITDHSFFADFLYWRLTSRYDQTFRQLAGEDLRLYREPAIIRGHQAQVQEFVQELHKKNIPVVVSPFIHSETIRQDSRPQYQMMLETFRKSNPEGLIDLDQIFAPYSTDMLKASRFDQHPNEFAHKLAAEALYQQLKPLVGKKIEYNK